MNNEIKEILRKDFEDTFNKEFVDIILELSFSNLLDYINNLQEENKHLDKVNCKLRVVIEELKTTNKLLLQQKRRLQKDLDMLDKRKDKAIEYINTHYLNGTETEDILLNILEENDK